MTAWFDVAVIAFLAQLAVLPGEKVQFIIAGLATRYRPLLVVGAAGCAFAGWTAVEVLLGSYLQRVVPAVYLAAMTGLLFLLFAGMLLRSAPASDGTVAPEEKGEAPGDLAVRVPVLGWGVPTAFGGFVPIFALMALGEVGDKTQLVTIGLATQYPHPTAIWVGEMAAIIPVSLVNAAVFFRFSHRFDRRAAHLVSAGLFAFFGIDTLQSLVTGTAVWEVVGSAVRASIHGLL